MTLKRAWYHCDRRNTGGAPRDLALGFGEGACNNLVGGRLKRAGMHWSVDGANAILALRCSILGNRFDDFWECRASGI